MIISEVENEEDLVKVRVLYNIKEARKLNEMLNCLTDMHSWITFLVKPIKKEKSIVNFIISNIKMFSGIENKEFDIPINSFSKESIETIYRAVKDMFPKEMIQKTEEQKKLFNIEEQIEVIPKEYSLDNKCLYGCSKFD